MGKPKLKDCDHVVVAFIHKRLRKRRYTEIVNDSVNSYELTQLLFDRSYPTLEMLEWTENMLRLLWREDYVEIWREGALALTLFPREVLSLFGYDSPWSRYATHTPTNIARELMREEGIPDAEIDHRLFGRELPTTDVLISAATLAVCNWRFFHRPNGVALH